MQTISSLLNLQSAQIQDEKAKEAILEGRGRVKAMALIHQKLYQQENISQVDLREYIQKLSQDLMYSHGYRPHEVKCTLYETTVSSYSPAKQRRFRSATKDTHFGVSITTKSR
jgi:two-component sensor histidine kinase